jgi:hypothetical protein
MGVVQAKTALAPLIVNKSTLTNLAFLTSADITFHAETSEGGYRLLIMAIWHGQHFELMPLSLPAVPTLGCPGYSNT